MDQENTAAQEGPMLQAKRLGLVGKASPSSGPLSSSLAELVGSIDHADQVVYQLVNKTREFHNVPHTLLHEEKMAQNGMTESADEAKSAARRVVELATYRINQLARRVEELTEILEV